MDIKEQVKLCKQMREQIGCGMMDAKKCLIQTEWDIDKAIEYYRDNTHIFGVRKLITYRPNCK